MKKSILFTLAIIIASFTACTQKQKQFAVIQEGDKKGLLNQNGYVVIKPTYKKVYRFDGSDDFATHPNYVNLHWVHNQSGHSYAIVQEQNNKFGVINQEGELLLKPIYDSISYFFNDFMKVEIAGKYGLVNRDFKIILKPVYDQIGEFAGDIATIKNNNRYGCINKDMEIKIQPTYDKIYFQKEEFSRITLNNKWGYIDNKCNILAKPMFDYAYDFSNKIAKVIINNKVAYIDSKGKLLSKSIFQNNSLSF